MAYSALEAFGHAKTDVHDNASRFGKYLELQFNEKGRMIGAKFSEYMLERSRITQTNGDDRCFHVFYYMLYGTTQEEKSLLHLDESASYDYLFKTREAARLVSSFIDQDAEKYSELRILLRSLGINKNTFFQIMQILSAILHLGNLQFMDDPTNEQDSAIIKNKLELEIIADLLGVETKSLETCLTYQTKLIKRDLTTIFLNAEQAALQRDALAETLYTLLFAWLVETINKRLNMKKSDSLRNFIGIIDFPGPAPIQTGSYHQFSTLYANEVLYNWMMHQLHERNIAVYSALNLTIPTLSNTQMDECVQLLNHPQTGIITLLSNQIPSQGRFLDTLKQAHRKHPCLSFKSGDKETQFAIQHFTGRVFYSPSELEMYANEAVCTDFVLLFGPKAAEAPTNRLVSKLFSQKIIENTALVEERTLATTTETSIKRPLRIDSVLSALSSTKAWYVLCLRSNDLLLPHSCDPKKLAAQIKSLHLLPLVIRARLEYTIDMDLLEFCERYTDLIHTTTVDLAAESKEKYLALQEALEWNEDNMLLNEEKVFLTEAAWESLENKLRATEKREQRRARCAAKGIPYVEESEDNGHGECHESICDPASCQSMIESGSLCSEDYYEPCCEAAFYSQKCDHSLTTVTATTITSVSDEEEKSERTVNTQEQEQKKEISSRRISPSRIFWVSITWLTTWWIPSFLLSYGCGMRRSDIRMAWREKVTLCVVILLLCAVMIWFIAFFGQLICPHQDLYTQSELQAKSNRDNAFIAIRGEVFDLTSFAPRHWASEVIPTAALFQYAGQDASDLFPVQISALCDGVDGYVPKEVAMDTHINITNSNAVYHDFRAFRSDYRPDWYYEQMVYLRTNYRLGFMGYDLVDIKNQATSPVQIGGIQRRRKCERSCESEPCTRCIKMKRKCIPQEFSSSSDSSVGDDDEVNERRYNDLYQQIEELQIELHNLEIDLNKQRSAAALIKSEPRWTLQIENGQLHLQTEIKSFEELSLYGKAFLRYLSPFGNTFKEVSFVFENAQPYALHKAITDLTRLAINNGNANNNMYSNSMIARYIKPEAFIDGLIDIHFHCFDVWLQAIHERSFRKRIEKINKLEDPTTLAICASASVHICRHMESMGTCLKK
ncbi:Putative Chitin synthase [Rhizopus microsporus]|nr:Putative Chitin synthase [Rhizopus microsporus]